MSANHNHTQIRNRPNHPELLHKVPMLITPSSHAQSVAELTAIIEDLKRENRELLAIISGTQGRMAA